MVDIAQTDAGQLSGNVLFYSKPEALSKETHAKLGVSRIARPYAFAAKSHVVPLTVPEFAAAALCYPIIFAGEKYQPLAVMGMNPDTNLFIGEDGNFQLGMYIPAYIRRYPFVLAQDSNREQLVVCVDRGAPMLGELPDLAFFDDKGEPTEYTKHCINFCNDFEVEVRRTESFVGLMKELDLFEKRTATHTPIDADGTAGQPVMVAEFYAISEDKLKALPNDRVRELLDNGALPQIYAHLTSLFGWDRLIALTFARNAANPPPANLN